MMTHKLQARQPYHQYGVNHMYTICSHDIFGHRETFENVEIFFLNLFMKLFKHGIT